MIEEKYQINLSSNIQDLSVPRVGGPWRDICKSVKKWEVGFDVATNNIKKRVGDGVDTKFWTD